MALNNRQPGGSDRRTRPALVEPLESRQLLAADLSVSVAASTLPPSVLTGSAGRGRLALTVQNTSADALARTAPRVDVQVVAVSQQSPNGVLVGQARNVAVGGLVLGSKAKKVNVSVSLPRSLAAGAYTLRVVADPQNRLGESEGLRTNNLVVGSNPIVVSSAFSRLSVTGLTYRLKSAAPGSIGTSVVSIRNLGNVPARGTASIRILASPSQSGISAVPAELGRVDNVRLSVGANKTIRYSRNLRFVVPVNVGLSSSAYVIFAEVIPGGILPVDTGSQQDRRGSSAQPVSIPASTRTDSGPLVFGLARNLTFTATQSFGDPSFGVAESGTVVDSAGRTGRYTYAFVPASNTQPQSTAFSLDFGVGPQGQPPFTSDYTIDFADGAIASFSTRTVEFGVTSGLAGTLKVRQTTDAGVGFRLV